jgi:glutamate/tyrosine decarboxylase-like PLP-dependent enzyme
MVREHLRLTALVREFAESDPRFELLAPADLALVCFRLNDGRDEAGLNELNKRFLDRVNAAGPVFLTHTALRGKFTVRFVVGQRTTEERHIRGAWDIVTAAAAEVLKG